MNPEEFRIAQARVMAEPERLRLLARLLICPAGHASAVDLSTQGLPAVRVRAHLQAMSDVGVVAPVGRGAYAVPRPDDEPLDHLLEVLLDEPSVVPREHQPFRVAPRGIVGFGVAALAEPRFAGDPALDPEDAGALLDRVTDTLSSHFAGSAGHATVARLVRESYGMLAPGIGAAPHLPAVTAWLATDRLAALTLYARPARAVDVLLVCTPSPGRSQIAAAVLRHLAGDRLRVRIAGSRTGGSRTIPPSDPTVRAALARRGLDGVAELFRPLTEDLIRASGVIVTMGCGDACPVLPGRRYLDWPVDDPVGRSPADVERIVDDVTARVSALVAELDALTGSSSGPRAGVGSAGYREDDGVRILRAVR